MVINRECENQQLAVMQTEAVDIVSIATEGGLGGEGN